MVLTRDVQQQMTAAMRARDTARRDALRLLIAAFQNARIAAGHELSDEEATRVLQREAKQRRESITEYERARREDLAGREREELRIIEGFLPRPLTEPELTDLARQVVAEVGASSPGDLGRVMRPLMERVAGRADGRRANEIVRGLLGGA
ncbi:MAG: GatB/YqeY domain-containing protein [Chloroflexi bacterium]|nr:GatB/YqeY domain-containing protein [Chloroflexota bacterium]